MVSAAGQVAPSRRIAALAVRGSKRCHRRQSWSPAPSGQIGSELVPELKRHHGAETVVMSDIKTLPAGAHIEGAFEHVDCTDSGPTPRSGAPA